MKSFFAKYLAALGAWALILVGLSLFTMLPPQARPLPLEPAPREYDFLVPYDPSAALRLWLTYALAIVGPPAVVAALWEWKRRRGRGQAA